MVDLNCVDIFGFLVYFVLMVCAFLELLFNFNEEKWPKSAFIYILFMVLWGISGIVCFPIGEIMEKMIIITSLTLIVWAFAKLIKSKLIDLMVAMMIVGSAMVVIWAMASFLTAGSINLKQA